MPFKTMPTFTDAMATTPQTNADRGLLIHGSLTFMRDAALKRATSADEALVIEEHFKDAIENLVVVTGVRVNTPTTLSTVTNDTQAIVLAHAARRVQQFLTTQFKSMDWTAQLMRPNKKLKNAVDYQVYDHLATVTQGRDAYNFCVNAKGRYVFSDQKYWTEPPVKVG